MHDALHTLNTLRFLDKTIGNTAVGVLAHTVHYSYTLPPQKKLKSILRTAAMPLTIAFDPYDQTVP